MTLEQFRRAMLNPTSRAASGIHMTDHEATWAAADAKRLAAAYMSWLAIGTPPVASRAPNQGSEVQRPRMPPPYIGPPDKSAGQTRPATISGVGSSKNTPATIGFVFGIASVFLFEFLVPGPTAIVLSSIGLSRAGRDARSGRPAVGRVLAIIGLVLGIVYTLLPILRYATSL